MAVATAESRNIRSPARDRSSVERPCQEEVQLGFYPEGVGEFSDYIVDDWLGQVASVMSDQAGYTTVATALPLGILLHLQRLRPLQQLFMANLHRFLTTDSAGRRPCSLTELSVISSRTAGFS